MSGLSLLRPVLLFSLFVALLTWSVTLWGMPTAQREMRDRLAEIRGDVAAAFLREGQFMSPAERVTIYIREMGRPGEMLGIFVQDEREEERPVTYTAERAVLLRDGKGTRLVMFDGMAQIAQKPDAPALQVLRFDQFAYDLSKFDEGTGTRRRKPSELYLPRLLGIDRAEAQEYGRPLGEFRAEGHEALSSPLYAIALPILAVAFVISMGFRRQGFTGRIIAAVVMAILLRLAGLMAKGIVTATPAAAVLLYLPPVLAVLAAVWMITQTGRGSVRARPEAAP